MSKIILYMGGDVTTGNHWNFKSPMRNRIDAHIFVIVGFVKIDQLNQQEQNNDTFSRPTFSNDQ